jgi:ferredoxin
MRVEGSLRLEFDAAKCDGYGMCSVVFPEAISVDQWGFALVEQTTFDDAPSQRRANRAVRCCPRQALSLRVIVGDTDGSPIRSPRRKSPE